MIKGLIKEILKEELTDVRPLKNKGTYLQVGKCYSFRTVTMIYTGKIKSMVGDEILLEKAAWVAETVRWSEYCKTLACKEVEPYCQDVVIFRSGLLDVFEVEEKYLPLKQK